jgi:4-hydroxybenzoate polyprenyltransferase
MRMLFHHPYARLMRLHQPMGILLLLWPCFAALALTGAPPALYAWFALGAVCMRASGCIINDLADRRFDAQVARTATRPLASGEIRTREALALLALLLAASLAIALQLRVEALLWAACSLPLIAAYPLMKRTSA